MAVAAIAQEADAPARVVVRDCPICGAVASHLLAKYSREPWHLVTCDSCGFVYLKEAPVYDRLVDELAWEKNWLLEKERRRQRNPLSGMSPRRSMQNAKASKKARVAKLFGPGNVLDVGCGGDTLTPDGYTPYGVEISEALQAKADAVMQPRGGRCVHAPAVEGVASFPDGFFSGIILSSFLEHEMQPAKLLAECARVLQPGGAIYVRVPNYGGVNRRVRGAEWCGFRHPDHVNYFTLDSLKALAERFGLKLRLLNPWRLAFDDNINAVLMKGSRAGEWA
jgi:SAM-dependent methyltransferase